MKVTMNSCFACKHPETGSPISGKPGQVVDLPDAMAQEFIASGYAFDHIAKAADEVAEKERQRAEHNAKKEQPSGLPSRNRAGRRAAKSE